MSFHQAKDIISAPSETKSLAERLCCEADLVLARLEGNVDNATILNERVKKIIMDFSASVDECSGWGWEGVDLKPSNLPVNLAVKFWKIVLKSSL